MFKCVKFDISNIMMFYLIQMGSSTTEDVLVNLCHNLMRKEKFTTFENVMN